MRTQEKCVNKIVVSSSISNSSSSSGGNRNNSNSSTSLKRNALYKFSGTGGRVYKCVCSAQLCVCPSQRSRHRLTLHSPDSYVFTLKSSFVFMPLRADEDEFLSPFLPL